MDGVELCFGLRDVSTFTKVYFERNLGSCLVVCFFMMWITVYNLQTLPLDLLLFAIPLSVLEVLFAVVIIKKVSKYL